MADLTLADCDRWLKHRAMAKHAGTPAPERANAERGMAMLEEAHPDIVVKALWAERAITSVVPPDFGDAPKRGGKTPAWMKFAEGLFDQKAQETIERAADVVAGQVTGQARFEPLAPGEIVIKDHACADDQACIEIRVRKRDIRRRLDEIVDQVHGALERRA